jgi:hypothetical protein
MGTPADVNLRFPREKRGNISTLIAGWNMLLNSELGGETGEAPGLEGKRFACPVTSVSNRGFLNSKMPIKKCGGMFSGRAR